LVGAILLGASLLGANFDCATFVLPGVIVADALLARTAFFVALKLLISDFL